LQALDQFLGGIVVLGAQPVLEQLLVLLPGQLRGLQQ